MHNTSPLQGITSIWDYADFILPPGRGERTPPYPGQYRPVLDLPTSEGWKAEFACARYGLCLWPIWYRLWPMWSVADFVCGRYGRGRYGLWPISS